MESLPNHLQLNHCRRDRDPSVSIQASWLEYTCAGHFTTEAGDSIASPPKNTPSIILTRPSDPSEMTDTDLQVGSPASKRL